MWGAWHLRLDTWHFREQGVEIVVEGKGACVIRVYNATGALVAGAQVTGRVILQQIDGRGLFDLSLPGAFGAMGRDQYPFAGEWIKSAVYILEHMNVSQQNTKSSYAHIGQTAMK